MKSQNEKIKKHLKKHGSISTWTAFTRYRITRLSARIWDLRNLFGMSIGSRAGKSGKKHFTVYYI